MKDTVAIPAEEFEKQHENGIKPLIVKVSDVPRETIQWLWPGRFALGKLSIIAGDGGTGKSHITIDMAARITKVLPWPDGGFAPIGNVIMMSAEDKISSAAFFDHTVWAS